MDLRYHLDWNDYHEAREFLQRDRYPMAPEKIIGGLILTASALWFFLDSLNLYAIIGLVAGLAVFFGAPTIRRWGARRKWEREPFHRFEHLVTVTDDGLEYQMGETRSNLNWPFYQRMIESPSAFLLVYGNDSFSLLPKRAFSDQASIDRFRELTVKGLKRAGIA
ncbi:MAG: YcxB family protein [Blastocatellales bacterium]